MRLAVWHVGKFIPSRFNYGKNCRVTLKGLDDNKSYYLNLTEAQGVVDRWRPILKEGTVVEAPLIEGTDQVNKFSQYQIIKKVEGASDGSK